MSEDGGINVRVTSWATFSAPATASIDLSHLSDAEFDEAARAAVGEQLAGRLERAAGRTYATVRVDDVEVKRQADAHCGPCGGHLDPRVPLPCGCGPCGCGRAQVTVAHGVVKAHMLGCVYCGQPFDLPGLPGYDCESDHVSAPVTAPQVPRSSSDEAPP